MRRRNKRFGRTDDESLDPMTAVANLFDFSLVFAVALMVALVTRLGMSELLTKEDFSIIKNPGKENMEIVTRKGDKVERYKASQEKTDQRASGKRVGIAYQLDDGQVVYVPE